MLMASTALSLWASKPRSESSYIWVPTRLMRMPSVRSPQWSTHSHPSSRTFSATMSCHSYGENRLPMWVSEMTARRWRVPVRLMLG